MSHHHALGFSLAVESKQPERQAGEVHSHVYVTHRPAPVMAEISDKYGGASGDEVDSESYQVDEYVTPDRYGIVNQEARDQ